MLKLSKAQQLNWVQHPNELVKKIAIDQCNNDSDIIEIALKDENIPNLKYIVRHCDLTAEQLKQLYVKFTDRGFRHVIIEECKGDPDIIALALEDCDFVKATAMRLYPDSIDVNITIEFIKTANAHDVIDVMIGYKNYEEILDICLNHKSIAVVRKAVMIMAAKGNKDILHWAIEHPVSEIRLTAVELCDGDKDILNKGILDRNGEVREATILRSQNYPDILNQGLNDSYHSIALHAKMLLTAYRDKETLLHTMKYGENEYIRCHIVENSNDRDVLELGLKDRGVAVVQKALIKLKDDPTVLKEALHHPHHSVRCQAISLTIEQHMIDLQKYVMEHGSVDDKEYLACYANDDEIIRMAICDENEIVRRKAISQLTTSYQDLELVKKAGGFRTFDPPECVYKICLNGVIVVATIPDDAFVRGSTESKCRTNKAKIIDILGDVCGEKIGVSLFNLETCYKIGDTVEIEDFDLSRSECSTGFHFFCTEQQAREYMK